ncbi:uncharacterized protein G2W53_003476 [Senna tora]|uniref:Uncharacterized protein n=1 Tax=Senna tora TaxID=362788 RepID=A0A834X8W5_9FABA|nr:uncharacterized protein G2W53_003476 [Senna tora]
MSQEKSCRSYCDNEQPRVKESVLEVYVGLMPCMSCIEVTEREREREYMSAFRPGGRNACNKACKGVSATWWPKHLCSIDARACLGTGTKPRVFRPPGGRNTRVVTSDWAP